MQHSFFHTITPLAYEVHALKNSATVSKLIRYTLQGENGSYTYFKVLYITKKEYKKKFIFLNE